MDLNKRWLHPLLLLAIAVLAYAILLPWLGFYWDDWPKAWFLHELGPTGFQSVFEADRPNLAWTYLITTSILGESPAAWQIFGILARWLTAVALWWLLKQVWPKKPMIALVSSLIYLVFPGFSQQNISLIYSHFLFIQAVHLFALGFMILAIRRPSQRVFWTVLSILGSVYSLFSIEYYVGWELLRPLLIYWVVSEDEKIFRLRLRQSIRFWLPYLPILPLYVLWRTQIIGYPTYDLSLFDRISAQPLINSVDHIIRLLLRDLIEVVVGSWLRIIPLPATEQFGPLSLGLVAAIFVVIFTLVGFYLYQRAGSSETGERQTRKDLLAVLVTGIWVVLISGWPFWVVELPLRMSFPNDRFMLAFALGGTLILVAALLALGLAYRTRVVGVALIAVFVGLGASQQVRYSTEYRRERDAQSNLLWQFIWRIPDLERGTTILINELPLKFDDDEAITGAINWLYGEDEQPGEMHYLVADLKLRLGRSFASLKEDEPIHKDYRATSFDGTTSQVVVISYNPPKCLRVYDVVLHDSLPGIPDPLPKAIPLSNLDLILKDSKRVLEPPLHVIGPEPPHRWCYYFQQADLELQREGWERIAELGDIAFGLGDQPNDASERLPFIEGYAHVGRWEDAARLSLDIYNEQPPMANTVCRTWIRLEQTTAGGTERGGAFDSIYNSIPCDELRLTEGG